MFQNWFQVIIALVTNCSEVTHSVPNVLSLYLDQSPEDSLLDYEERIYQSFQIWKQTWFTEYVLLFNLVLLYCKIRKNHFSNVSNLFKWVFKQITEYCQCELTDLGSSLPKGQEYQLLILILRFYHEFFSIQLYFREPDTHVYDVVAALHLIEVVVILFQIQDMYRLFLERIMASCETLIHS